ncbi:threonine synthase [Salisediminibacterium beveridgei]|uniref:Threonine synthase n=1 Tax=Salisediminibacterium beveridgei TaxID=632773 RepID=A0A1D7QS64_9BACI|nr:threonine synthase [Salisediminibacterium beveridgei]AOM81847.1 Threonine synthase [Salisediminibacterium beveridgei]
MTNSCVRDLYCPKCEKRYPSGEPHQLCTCGAPLLVAYDLKRAANTLSKSSLTSRAPTLWRYSELLPVQNPANQISFGEGMTPILPMNRMGEDIGIDQLLMKDEGLIPGGSFKSRGAAVGVSMAHELGIEEIAMPTNGNAGAAWAMYAARAGIKTHIVMPVDAPIVTRKEAYICGADLHLVNGLISDAGKIVGRAVKKYDWFDVSTLKEPYRIEGKKTMGYEIAEQLNWQVPDVILYPTGGGVGIIGIYKALKEFQEMGLLDPSKMPRLVAVQAEECAPIVTAFQKGESESEFWPESKTAAFGINVPKAIGDFLVLDAIYETNGTAIAIDDPTLLAEQRMIAETEGTFICPEGAATFAAARQLRHEGWIERHEQVLCLNTGMGIKYPETVDPDVPTLQPEDDL